MSQQVDEFEKAEILESAIVSTRIALSRIRENLPFYGAPNAVEEIKELSEKLKEVLECLKQKN